MTLPTEFYFDDNSTPIPPHITLSALDSDGSVLTESFPMRPAPNGIARVSTLALWEFLNQLPPAQVKDSVYIQFDSDSNIRIPNEFDTSKRLRESTPKDASLYLGNKALEIRPLAHMALLNTEPLPLEPIDFNLLTLLAERPEEALSRHDITEILWKDHKPPQNPRNALACIVHRIRQKLGPTYGHTRRGIIRTVTQIGYLGVLTLPTGKEDLLVSEQTLSADSPKAA